VHCVGTDASLEQVIARMREAGVRRMPVVREGELVGLVTLDDLVVQLTREMASLSGSATTAIDDGRRAGRRKRRRADLEESIAALEASAIAAGREAVDFVSREFDALRERFRRPPE
jgi:CBS domain containing-hemolysin-like protein